uniref:Uncharacterized protein n=1 Tax=Graphocephala atropunctata TaxID=36148 RepID=A0A1B6LZ48_9HEMI
MDDSEVKMGNKRKYKSQTLPEGMKSVRLRDLMQAVTTICQKMEKRDHKDEGQLSSQRVINVLVRGLGSSNIQVQKNYFVALVALLKTLEMSPGFTAKNVLDAIESELHITGNTAKGEGSEILMGRVLTFGTLVRSGALTAAPVDDQVTAVSLILQDLKNKSYLPLVGDPFLIDYLNQVEESTFKKAVWPVLKQEVRPGPNQTLLMFHLLLVCEERFPSVVSAKFLKKTMMSPRVLSTSTISGLLAALTECKLKVLVNHPAIADVFKFLTASEGIVLSFWQQVEDQLLSDVNEVSNKHIMALQLFNLILLHLQNASQVIELLTPKLVSILTRKVKVSAQNNGILCKSCKEVLENLHKLCKNADSSKTVLSIIKKLLFTSGNVFFEQSSGVKLVHKLTPQLKDKGVMKLAVLLQAVITGSSSALEYKGSETSTRQWHNKEKLYTVHMFSRLLTLPVMQTNTEWMLEKLTFLFDMGFFSTSNIGVELACNVRESFFSCLNLKLPNLVVLRSILAGVVEHINSRLDKGDQLRIKVTSEVLPAWKKMLETAKQIDKNKNHKQELWVTSVFQTMFYHIGLHLFKEATFAADFLQELHSVYERIGVTTSSEEEPHWTEVVVEMFLSLLSRNSQLHRHLIGCIFSHFCPIMVPQNIHQILQILDPSTNTNPLLNNLDPDSESSAEEDESEGSGEEEDGKESSDDGMTDFEEDEEEEKVNDKLRRAVVEALGDTGAMTDVESVDLEDMDEDEGARVDKALSEAFKALKPLKNKKQSLQAKALTHFRLRVLDLIEVWIVSEPPLDLLVDTLLRLVSLLEHSLVDRHQAPLEIRVRSVIKKLTATKKYDVSDSKTLPLGNILKSLIEKGDRTTTVYMSVSKELTASTIFIVKASQLIDETESDEDPTNVTVLSVLKDIVKSFFLQRDCLLTAGLFEKLFTLNIPFIVNLSSKLTHYIFDPKVHPFRRYKALEFLMIFWKTNRILLDSIDDHLDSVRKMSKQLYKGFMKVADEPFGRVQVKFVKLLRKVFFLIQNKNWLPDVDWPNLIQSLTQFQKTHCGKSEAKNKKTNGSDSEDGDDMEVEHSNEQETDVPHVESEEELVSGPEDTEEVSSEEDGEVEEVGGENSIEEDKSSEESEEPESELKEEPVSEPEEEPSKKKSEKKRKHEKIKRTQLLKNNSKKMRLEAMAVGLDENLFSNYKMLMDNTTPPSPER